MDKTQVTHDLLKASGWQRGPYWCDSGDKKRNQSEPSYEMTDSLGRHHQINVNFTRQLVTCHRMDVKGQLCVDGIIGRFVGGGKGRKRATKASAYLGGIKYLDKVEGVDAYYKRKYPVK